MRIRLIRQLMLATDDSGRVSLSDVEQKLRDLGSNAQSLATDAAPPMIGGLVAAGVVAVAAVYLLGRRRGSRRASVLEIRRVCRCMAGRGSVVRSYLDRWARQLVRRGVRSGLIEGSNLWLSIGAIAWLFRFLSKRPSPQVSVEQLRLGESLIVSHVPAPPRSRRARKKAARKAAKLEQRVARQQAKREASRRYRRAQAKAALVEAERQAKAARRQARCSKEPRRRRGEEPAGRGHSERDAEEAT